LEVPDPPAGTSANASENVRVEDSARVASGSVGRHTVIRGEAHRPVKEILDDPLGEVARKERRMLLGLALLGVFVGWTGFVPVEVTAFGHRFSVQERLVAMYIFTAMLAYFLVAFLAYAIPDGILYWLAVKERRHAIAHPPKPKDEEGQGGAPQLAPWPPPAWLTTTFVLRLTVDFIVPALFGGFAIFSMWRGIGLVRRLPSSAVTLGDLWI
jgi:hypothetical protein